MAQSFETWLQQLREKRKRWVDANHENNFDRGIWNATVEKYADPTHFIFELLQNAEDAGATQARFQLEHQAIIFEHNGRAFNREDIEAITGIGITKKLEEANKIGCFGIGFKSVYVVTQRPEVHCTIEGMPIAFGIRDLVVPELIATSHTTGATRIILPLPSDKAEVTIAKVRDALNTSGSRSLLFLQSLTCLEWADASATARCVVEDGAGGVRTLRSTESTKPAVTDRFLVLTRPVRRENDARHYSVKIAMRLNAGGDIIQEPAATRLAVFFETEDPTGLHFRVHGPFQLTDNRANIKRDDPWNTYLINEVSTLLADSLPDLRDRGMIKRSFLEVMPNANDDLPEPWLPLLAAVIEAFQAHELLPAHSGGHTSARTAVRGPSDVRDLLGDEGLTVFGALPNYRWVASAMRSSRTDAFLATLKLTEWGFAEFLTAFQRAFAYSWHSAEMEASGKAQAWFDVQSDDKVQRLYLLVEAAMRAQKRSMQTLTHLSFVRLEDGTRAKPSGALLSPADTALDEEAAAHGLVLVRPALTRTGRTRGKEVEQFLRKAGVKDISERDYLVAIIRSNYAGGARPPTNESHLQHMRRFLRWHAESGDCILLDGVAFLRAEGADGFHTGNTIYLDTPFIESGLSRIYGGRVQGRNRRPLWTGYTKLKRQELLALMKAAGAEERLSVERTRISYSHPKSRSLFYGFGGTRTTSTETNSDYTIAELPALLTLNDAEVSKMIWKAVSAVGVHSMYAHYAPNQTHEPHRELSTLAFALQRTSWISAKDGTFRRPSAITRPELAPGFSTAGNDAWLNIIDFGADNRQRSEEHLARRRAAQTIGLPAELADQLGRLSPDALKSFSNEMLRRIARGAFVTPDFPEREAPNPERRAERLAERARAAPAKVYEVRSRNVRTTDKDVRQMARPYLRDLYTNPAGDMVCQACHRAMPFRLADGKPYFEAPEFLQSVSTELKENHLGLCPTCCAKWQNANSTTDAEIGEAIQSADEPELSVTLAGEVTRLRFVKVHFDDLRTIFGVASHKSPLAKSAT
ncbi:MAG TPA: hypothetical protein VH206_01320 [Xanthobacteraceae bacterium]|jgi:hypothetical protein|nr:hypothetical protein [Xanthobacteraceae bacterium]